MENTELRLTRLENVCNQLRGEMEDVLHNAYQQACEREDAEEAAAIARKIRNRLLDKSDKECTLDKMLPEAPEGSSFSAWLGWLKDLAGVATNNWAIYRQRLRDLTEQQGFPFEIEWPVSPDEENISAE